MSASFESQLTEYAKTKSFLEFRKSINEFDRLFPVKPQTNFIDARVALLSNYSTQFIARTLKPALSRRNIWPSVYEDVYNQWEISPRLNNSPLYASKPEFVVFLISSVPLAYSPHNDPGAIAARINQMVRLVQQRSGAKVLLSLPEPLPEDMGECTWAHQWREAILSNLNKLLPDTCFKFNIDHLIRTVGHRHWYSHRYFVISKFPFHPENTKIFTEYLADILADLVLPQVKLIITDLDNTLWSGVVGEVGSCGVDLNFQDRGYGHLRLQRFLLHMSASGVLLAIASKNNAKEALDVFNTRPEMVLKESLFSSIRINWEKKSRNIKEILDELKLSSSGVVFLDDSPFERAEVSQAIPEIIVPELGKDPADWVDQLYNMGIFYRHIQTKEDKIRVKIYKTEAKRLNHKGRFGTEEDFLKSLELTLRPHSYEGNEQRVINLFSKTNQFNLTTRRHTKYSLDEALIKGGRLFIYELEDKFGSYGIVSVSLVLPIENHSYKIDSWLMSCRVIGRGVEKAVMECLVNVLRKEGGSSLIGEYIPSGKNKIVETLYEDLGFKRMDENKSSMFFQLDLTSDRIVHPKHFCKFQ